MANIRQSNLPQKLNMDDFISALDNLGSVAKSCRFIAKIMPNSDTLKSRLPNSDDFHLICDAAEFPGRGFNVTEARYYGPTRVFPNNTVYDSGYNLSFICRSVSRERQFFDDWMNFINPVNDFNFAYPNEYYADIGIYQLSEYSGLSQNSDKPNYVYAWRLRNAWPTVVNPQQVTWADSDILRLQVTFTYRYWDRPELQQS